MSPRRMLIEHALTCRLASADGRECPMYVGHLCGEDLSMVNLREVNLTGVDLSGANLIGADLTDANLMGANLAGANLMGAILVRANLMGANLAGANLLKVNLTEVNLTEVNLTGASFKEGLAYGYAITGYDGDHRWWAVLLQNGMVLLQYGCVRHTLDWWRLQGPNLSKQYGYPSSHWQKGPAVAIAAAEDLCQKGFA